LEKTYAVQGISGCGVDKETTILYVGQNKIKAKDFHTDEYYHSLVLEVWIEGVVIQSYDKDKNKWKLGFDKLKTINEVISDKELKKIKIEEEINLLKNISNIEDITVF
jgi:hypothetical protein